MFLTIPSFTLIWEFFFGFLENFWPLFVWPTRQRYIYCLNSTTIILVAQLFPKKSDKIPNSSYIILWRMEWPKNHHGGSTAGIYDRFCYQISPIDSSTYVWCGLELGQCPLLSRDDLLEIQEHLRIIIGWSVWLYKHFLQPFIHLLW